MRYALLINTDEKLYAQMNKEEWDKEKNEQVQEIYLGIKAAASAASS